MKTANNPNSQNFSPSASKPRSFSQTTPAKSISGGFNPRSTSSGTTGSGVKGGFAPRSGCCGK